MKILVFTEGTILMHQDGKDLDREDRVRQSHKAGIQREERWQKFGKDVEYTTPTGSVHDYANYIPINKDVQKLTEWKNQGAIILYLTSRRIGKEIKEIKNVLERYNFPDSQNLYFRKEGEDYKDVAEKIKPDILVEDDCESIGGEKEMTYPHIRSDLRNKIKSVIVKEFEGIDKLPDNIYEF
ncbi:hypothetical protein HYS93_01515 [Candidatus Daviesbacteria bacterium]|nr:hypothetical protein [Candidatus Daviesbacteria bacterium]